jgi:hypothetical protein
MRLDCTVKDVQSYGPNIEHGTLDLRQCPGIEPVGAVMLNVLPIFTALRHDQHFKSVIISGVSRKDIVHLLADALKTNSTLTKIAVVETEGDSTAFSCLAAALRDNQSIALQQIDLSGHLSFGSCNHWFLFSFFFLKSMD